MPDKLKKGWTKVAFGDVVRLSRERSRDPVSDGFERYIGLEHLDPEDLKIRRWGNVADGTTFTSVFRAGQVLFGKRRAYQKKLAVPDFDGVCSGDIYVLEPRKEHLLPELLPFICQTDSFFDHAVGTSAGSLSPRTNWKSLAEYEFALPPLDEQRRIAEVLGAIMENQEALFRLKESIIMTREAYAFSLWSDPLNKIQYKKLDELCEKIQDGTHFSPSTLSSGDFMYITSKHIKDGYLDLTDVGWVSKENHESIYKRCDVRFGDVLLTKDGANAGNVAINNIHEPVSLLSSVAFIRTKRKLLLTDYLFEYLRSIIGRSMLLIHVKGSAITRLILHQIRQTKIPLFTLGEQKTICRHFEKMQNNLNDLKQKQNELERIRISLLKIGGDAS